MRNVLYHYKESGLDNVFLKGGIEYHHSPGGKSVTIHDLDGLHKVIGRALACQQSRFTGKEFRFLRSELLLSQAVLAKVIGVKELTIGRWERGETEIPLSAEIVIRMLYLEKVGGSEKVKKLLENIADLEDEIDNRKLTVQRKENGRWMAEAA